MFQCPGCGQVNSMLPTGQHQLVCKYCGYKLYQKWPPAVLNALNLANHEGKKRSGAELTCINHHAASASCDFLYSITHRGAKVIAYRGRSREIVVPDEINGVPVVGIGKRVFFGLKMTSAVLPRSVRFIQDEAFAFCRQLVGVEAPGVSRIGQKAFRGCGTLSYVSFAECVDAEHDSFSGCYNLHFRPAGVIFPGE